MLKIRNIFYYFTVFLFLFAALAFPEDSPDYNSGQDTNVDSLSGDTTDNSLIDSDIIDQTAGVVSSATSITLNETTNLGDLILMTAAGEVGFPDCDTDLIGWWAVVYARDTSEQIELVMSGDITNDLFHLKDGTDLDANDEADMPTDGGQHTLVMCVENNKWYIVSSDGDVTDGGVAD
jgi:hypothetical protein